MFRGFYSLILVFFFFTLSCLAQHAKWKQVFSQAADSATHNRWLGVKDIIKPHLFPPPQDSLTPKLLMLYALACEKTGDRISAFTSAERLIHDYPFGPELEVAHYLLGKLNFKFHKYTIAWQHFGELPESWNHKLQDFIENEDPIPTDSAAKLELLEKPSRATTQMILNGKRKNNGSSQKPGIPEIGVAFPFQLKNGFSPKSEGQFYDFYRGMLLASEVLAASDSAVDIHAFDTENKNPVFSQLIQNKAFDGLEVLIGPLKSNHLELWIKSVSAKKVPLINPLSSPTFQTTDLPVFNQQPFPETMAREGFQFMSRFSTGSRVGIVFGTEKSDSILALAYSDYVKKMGRQVTLFKKVGKNSAANLSKFLVESGLDSTDHLFVPNNETLVRVQLLSAYTWIKGKFPILIAGKWLESSNADYEELAQHPIYFINPDLPDRKNSNWNAWERSFMAKWGKPPGWAAWKGFDLTLSFARSWYKWGPKWAAKWKSGEEIPSALFGKYQFAVLQPDNLYIPIFAVSPEEIQKISPE